MKKVCVVGLGYIGLPTAIVAAEHGLMVYGFDINQERVDHINNGNAVIEEPEVGPRLAHALATQRLHAYTQPQYADIFVIAVPTPINEDKTADLSYVWAATESIVPVLKQGNVVVIESTVSVGTTQQVACIIYERTGFEVGRDVFVAFCPERVLPGNIFYELVYNDRVVGGITENCSQQAALFYKSFVQGTISLSTAPVAEMVKLVENSSRDVSIAFAHEVARMAESAGLNPHDVIELANKHPRVKIMQPTCGVGGHCIAVDPWFLVESFPEQTPLIHAARLVNDDRPHRVFDNIRASLAQEQLHKKSLVVLVCGLAYKANVDDMRESPALEIARSLHNQSIDGVKFLVCDPYLSGETIKTALNDCDVVKFEEGIALADVIIMLVGHKQFTCLDMSYLRDKLILDYCGVWHRSTREAQLLSAQYHMRFNVKHSLVKLSV